jgi:peptide/nickel transport system permease protein
VSAVPVATATASEASKRKGFWSLLRSTGAAGIASAVVVVLAIAVAIVGPYITTSDPTLGQLSQSYVGTVGGHLLGFDGQGRDVVSRLLAGARSSMVGPLAVVAICMTIGTVFAVTSAWKRGTYDAVVSSGIDVLFAFPGILLAILAATVFGAGLPAAALALAIAYTPYVARVLRGAALKERGQQYVDALSVQGASSWSICLKHLIPNMTPLIVAQATILFGYAMVDLAAISFLGLGVQAPNPDWGVMVSENQSGVVQGYPLPALAAGICIVVVVVAFNVLGERLYERAEARNR